MNKEKKRAPLIIGAGLVVLDIIDNSERIPLYRAGGTCGNVLAVLSYLGWKSTAITRAGDDAARNIMTRDLSFNKVDVTYITREKKLRTPRIIERLDTNTANPKHTFLLQCPKCKTYLPRFRSPRLDIVEDIMTKDLKPQVFFFDRISPGILKLARHYKDTGALIFYEPTKLKNLNDMENAIGLSHVMKYSSEETTLSEGERKILEKYIDTIVIKTVGKNGLFFKSSGSSKWHHQKSIALRNIIDSCGAGDWCTAGFLYSMYGQLKQDSETLTKSYKNIKNSLKYGQVLSSLSCNYVGARGLSYLMNPTSLLKDVDDYINGKCDLNPKIIKMSEDRKKMPQKSRRLRNNRMCPMCLQAT